MKKFFHFLIIVVFSAFSFSVHANELTFDSSSQFVYPDYSKSISMDFQDARLSDVLKIFSEQSNLNLVTAESVASRLVTVYLDNVPVEQALEQILRANNLTYELQPNSDIYIVKPANIPPAELITRVYPLKYATVSTAKIKDMLSFEAEEGESSKSDSSTDSDKEGLLAAITAILTEKGSIIEDPRTNSLVVTDIKANFNQIERTIARLDIPMPQVLIEVEMLDVSKATADLLGIKPGSTPLTFSGAQRDHVYPWNQNDLIAKGYTFKDPEYRVGTIDASGLSATIQWLRTQSDTKSLARPRILTLNNEMAEIRIETDEAIGTQTQVTSSEGLGSSSSAAERVETGVSLRVTPQINILTEEITMAIEPRVTVAKTGGTFSGQTFKDPEIRSSKSILRIQSGDTIILGGLLREEDSKTITKIPVLGDLPFIGAAFRHKDKSTTQRELIIFITPHIVKDAPPYQTAVAKPQELIREQHMPDQAVYLNRSKNIARELSEIENKSKRPFEISAPLK